MIHLDGVSKSYDGGATFAVRGVTLRVAAGEFFVIVGESGSGKTTTLKMINRLIEPTRGRVEVDGKDVATLDPVTLRRGIGYTIQGVGLLPHLTVAENVALVPTLLGWAKRDIEARVAELLELVGMPVTHFGNVAPERLSGGQKQRVGLARALAARPRIMLMDEPFGSLDPLTRTSLQEQYSRIHRELGLTTVMVTHDMTEALLLADRIGVMFDEMLGPIGTPRELLAARDNDYVEALLHTPRRQAERIEAMLAGPR